MITNKNLGNICHQLPLMIMVHNQSTIQIFQVMNMTVTLTVPKISILLIMIQDNQMCKVTNQKSTIIREITENIKKTQINRILLLKKCSIITVLKEIITSLMNKQLLKSTIKINQLTFMVKQIDYKLIQINLCLKPMILALLQSKKLTIRRESIKF